MPHQPRRANGGQSRHHPGVERYLEKRSGDAQARLADAITAFAGSMPFVYVHVAVFIAWMFLLEAEPWPTLTLVVSLEAIFLSTFVMIGQNRQAAVQQAKADHDFVEQELELKANTQLTREIHVLVAEAVRAREGGMAVPRHRDESAAEPAKPLVEEGGHARHETSGLDR